MYRRKTIEKWKFDGLKVALFFVLISLIPHGINQIHGDEHFVTPAPSNPTIIIEQEVPTYKILSIEDEICAVFGDACAEAIAVARCESGLDPNAANPDSSARGLFQIMASVHGVRAKWLFNPSVNIRVAKQLYDEQGWNPWICNYVLEDL